MIGRRFLSHARRNFGLRIYLSLAGSLVIFAATLTAVSVRVQGGILEEQIRREGTTLAALLADSVRIGVFSENQELLSGALDTILGHRDVRQIWVFNAQEKLLQHRARQGAGKGYTFWAPVVSRRASASDENLYLPDAPQPSTLLGRVAVEVDDSPLRRGRRSVLAHSVAAALSFLVLAALATALVVREATRPLRGLLAEVARHGFPVPEAAAGDLGLLRDTFGHLVQSLNGALRRITDLTAGLERSVDQRTGELRRANEDLARARDELEQRVQERTNQLEHTHLQLLHAEKLGAIGRLAASIAHEFNNPIFGIRSVLQSVEKLAILPADEAETVGMAIGECNRVAALIRDLQSFNRPSQGVPGPVDLHQALDALLLLCRKELGAKGAQVEKDYAAGRLVVWGVDDQLKQVFLNLLTNAMDALPAAGGTIRISTEAEEGMISVRFTDTGSGIAEEHVPHLFEPFFTTKPAVKGTGLGLSVSYGIVESHGGTIQVESRLGEGSTFTVRLPVERARS